MKQKSKTNKKFQLIKLESFDDVKNLLRSPTNAIAEFLTGLLSKSNLGSSYVLSAGKIVQASIKGKLLHQLGEEIEKYRKEGRIKEDYFATHKNQATLLELLQFIDSDIPDEEIFNAMKSIFFTGIAIDASTHQEEITYQLLLLCKKLNSMDILIINACYKIYTGKDLDGVNTGIKSFSEWVNIVSDKIGYDLPGLVASEDDKLIELGLLTHKTYTDKSGVNAGKEFRLTKLGIKLCEHINDWK